MIATFSSLCPVCGIYIAKSRSNVERLAVGILPQVDLWPRRLRDGWAKPRGDCYDPATDAFLPTRPEPAPG